MTNGKLTYADLPEIYTKLSVDLPIEGAEKASKDLTRKGYDTTGYGYQFHVNRMNEVLFGHWRAIHQIVKETEGKTSTGKPMYRMVSHMIIQLGNWVTVDGENQFEVLMEVEGYGGHSSLELESAYKGSYTNAFKKATAMLGVGKKAFEGTLDDDLIGIEQPQKKQLKQTQRKQYQNKQPTQQQQQTQPPKVQEQPKQEKNLDAWKALGNKQRKRFFAICGKKDLTDKHQKLLVFFYTDKVSRADVTETEYQQINEVIDKANMDDINHTIKAAIDKSNAQKKVS